MEHVQGSIGLWEELTPQERRHSIVTSVDDGDELGLEGLDGALCKVVTVIVGVAEEVLDVLFCDGAAEEVRNFIVKVL